MARNFVATSSQRLVYAGAVLTVPPITMACWFLEAGASSSYGMVSIGNSGDDHHYSLLLTKTGVTVRAMVQRDAAFDNVDTVATYTVGAWNHACAVFAATNDRRVYLNGGNKQTDTTPRTNPTVNQTVIGQRGDNADVFFDGAVAEVGIWDAALTDDDVAILAKGIAPRLVRPQNLVAYWPLIANDNDPFGGFGMSAEGSPTFAAHPRQFYRGGPIR